MNSGKFRHKAQIWSNESEGKTNKLGEKIYIPVKKAELFVKFENRTGAMLYGKSAGTKTAKSTHKISLRYKSYPFLDYGNYFVINNQRFDIEYIDNLDNRNELLEVFVLKTKT